MNQSTLQEPVPTIGRRGAFFLLLPVVLAPTIGTLSALWFWPGPLGSSIYTVCKAILYGLPFILWLRVSTQERPSYKCSLKWILAGLGSGALIGLLILLVWFFLLESSTDTGPLLAVVEENGLDGAVKFWLFGAWLCLGNSFLEEFVFRWFVDGRLRQMGLGWNAVVPISAAIFTLHHVFVLSAYVGTALTVFGSVGVFIGGILWSILRLNSMSLIPGWLSHALVDLAIILIGASVLNVWPYG